MKVKAGDNKARPVTKKGAMHKNRGGEKRKLGEEEGREAWLGARAGSVPQMCPNHPEGECAEWTGKPSAHKNSTNFH